MGKKVFCLQKKVKKGLKGFPGRPAIQIIKTRWSRTVPMTTSHEARDKNFAEMTFSFQCGLSYFIKGCSYKTAWGWINSLHWRHNERDGISNHQPHDCLFNRLFRHRSKKTSKLHVTGLCEGNLPVTGEFPAQRASNAEKCFHLMTSSCDHLTYRGLSARKTQLHC